MVVFEVKGGGIQIDNGRWQSTDRFGGVHDIKNPFEQALASKYALIDWLKKDAAMPHVSVGHGVIFPHLNEIPHLGTVASSEITWSKRELETPTASLNRLVVHWNLKSRLTDDDIARIVSLLAPTVRVKRSLANESAVAEDALLRLTAEQVEAFSGLRASRGGLVVGDAGTGKTILAIARAQQLAADGFRTLFLCYNELLGAALFERFSDTPKLTASTYHSLCFREAKRAGLQVSSNPPQSWWENDAAEMLIEACALTDSQFDAIVIDEGQDFAPNWIESLRCLVSSQQDAPFFAFADPRQELWGRNWSDEAGWPFTYVLHKNLRNTAPIASKVSAVFEHRSSSWGANGPRPIWRDIENPKRPERDVVALVEHLVDDGFGPRNMVVLCSSPILVNRLRQMTVASFSFGRWGSNGIPVETISRFKGLEAEAVVVVLEDAKDSLEKILAYVGLSRARSILAVVGTGRMQGLINWNYSPSVVRSK
jgi:hypothetical protein